MFAAVALGWIVALSWIVALCWIVALGWIVAVRPTLLGVDPWSCYWEWVWQSLGDEAYMHRPTHWGVVEFVRWAPPLPTFRAHVAGEAEFTGVTPKCKNIEFPGRHVHFCL
jgi:hypothetical protein